MEKNTVILDIVRYDSLIESEKKANEPKMKIDELENVITGYKMKYPETKTEVTIDTLKKMSIFKLIKWKFKK